MLVRGADRKDPVLDRLRGVMRVAGELLAIFTTACYTRETAAAVQIVHGRDHHKTTTRVRVLFVMRQARADSPWF